MNKGQAKKVVEAAKEAEKPPSPYEPTPADAEALKAYRVAKAKRGPRLKVSGTTSTSITRIRRSAQSYC